MLLGAAGTLPAPAGLALNRFLDHLEQTPAGALATDYVETFDLRRRCCLYLTYYTFGDTRKRGAALVRFTHAYRQAGLDPPASELPDHLAVVCHFAALAPTPGVQLLVEHRAAIEVLRLSLAEPRSAYLDVVDALRAVLPTPPDTDLARAVELARRGPPAEEVGLEPFGPPEYMGAPRR
jgi:nitrate reductase delta subunit